MSAVSTAFELTRSLRVGRFAPWMLVFVGVSTCTAGIAAARVVMMDGLLGSSVPTLAAGLWSISMLMVGSLILGIWMVLIGLGLLAARPRRAL